MAALGAPGALRHAYRARRAAPGTGAERALVAALSDSLKVPAGQLPERVRSLVTRLRAAEKELSRVRASQVLATAGAIAAGAQQLDGTRIVVAEAPPGVAAGDLRSLVLDVRGR